MFKNLQHVLDEKHITRTQLAKLLGLDIKSITNKMAGISEWKLSEIQEISKLFPEYSMDWLFAKAS